MNSTLDEPLVITGGGNQLVATSNGEKVCVTVPVTHTLTCEGSDASEDGTGRGNPIVEEGTGVRRLTPLECERLQGFPDGWTKYGTSCRSEIVISCQDLNALWPDVFAKMPPVGSASCITSDLQNMEVWICRPVAINLSRSAEFVTGWLEKVEVGLKDYVDGTTSPKKDTAIHSKLNVISNYEESSASEGHGTIGQSLNLHLAESSCQVRLSTISTWMHAMTSLETCTSVATGPSMDEFTLLWKTQQRSFSAEDYCVLRVVNILQSSDSARYRMLGNAVAVPVVEWIAKRLVEVDEQENAGLV